MHQRRFRVDIQKYFFTKQGFSTGTGFLERWLMSQPSLWGGLRGICRMPLTT